MLDAATPTTPAHPDLSDVVELSDQAASAWAEEPVTYTAVLAVPRRAVRFVADLLQAHWRQLGTRPGRRALDAWEQAVAFWRVMLDDVEPDRLAVDLGIGRSTAHRDIAETRDIVAAKASGLHGALLAARAAGHTHVNLVPHCVGGAPRHPGAHRPGVHTGADDRPGQQEQRAEADEG